MSDVLPAEAALAVGYVACAQRAVPGAVRVSGQAALGAGFAVSLTAVQLHLGHTCRGAHVQGLLCEVGEVGREKGFRLILL